MTLRRTVLLCHTAECCPVVEIRDEGVTIGEEGNRVFLKPEEWETLRRKVRAGEL